MGPKGFKMMTDLTGVCSVLDQIYRRLAAYWQAPVLVTGLGLLVVLYVRVQCLLVAAFNPLSLCFAVPRNILVTAVTIRLGWPTARALLCTGWNFSLNSGQRD